MKIRLDLIENRNPCTIGSLYLRINENLKEQELDRGITSSYKSTSDNTPRVFSKTRTLNLVFNSLKKNIDVSQLYSTIIDAGYSIKTSEIIKEEGLSTDNKRLANDYMETKARFNPEKTWGMMISKHNSKLTNAEVQK